MKNDNLNTSKPQLYMPTQENIRDDSSQVKGGVGAFGIDALRSNRISGSKGHIYSDAITLHTLNLLYP